MSIIAHVLSNWGLKLQSNPNPVEYRNEQKAPALAIH